MTDMPDPFAGADDMTDGVVDPFASSESLKKSGKPFVPAPSLPVLQDRLIVMVPREHDKDAEVSKYLQEQYGLPPTREEWTIDLVILDGPAPFSYEFRGKDKDSQEYVTKTWEIKELPALIPNFRVTWGNIIGQLNTLATLPTPFGLGRIRAGYSAKAMRGGKTFADFAAEVDAWKAAVRKDPDKAGQRPKPTWHFEVSDAPEDKAVALAWWKQAKADGFSVV